MVISEVKGIWFLVAREQLEQQFGAAGFQDVLDAMPAEFQHALREPLASSWYAEEALQEALRAMRHTLVPDADDCRALLFSCTQRGVGRFFRAMMRLSSPHFVLRQVPTMWKHIRRDRARIDVSLGPEISYVTYSRFPYFSDENYRLLVEGSLRALLEPSVGHRVLAEVHSYGDDWLRVAIRHV